MADVRVTARVDWRDESGRYAAAVDAGAQKAQLDASKLGAAIAAGLAPKRTGALAAITADGSGYSTPALRYAIPQEEGAGAHVIGDAGQTLANEAEGFGPVKGPVMHPGNPAVHFMRNSLRIVNQRIMAIIRANMP